MKEKTKKEKSENKPVGTACQDRQCAIHGSLAARGRVFSGKVTKKFPRRIVIEFERTVYIRKYERYAKKKAKIHARLPECSNVEIGDFVQVQECRPLSKIIHFVFIKKIRSKEKGK